MTYITAHSGSDQTEENSLRFVEFFRDKPVDALEIDVRKNSRGQLVLNHDQLVVGEDYLSLNTFLIAMKGTSLKLNCDLKESNLEIGVFELAQRHNKWSDILLSGNVDPKYLKNWPTQLLMNIENAVDPRKTYAEWDEGTVIEGMEHLAKQGAKIINMPEELFTEKIYETGQALAVDFSLWTVNDLNRIEELVAKNIYNVTSRQAWAYLQRRTADEISKSQTSVS
jgi:hypothetical protein